VGETEVEGVVERLSAEGALDDARFARDYAADKRELAGWGPDRIRDALFQRGIPYADIEAALSEEDELSQIERAAALLTRRGPPPSDDVARQRELGYLARRGFSSEVAYEAVRRHRRAA
jgi:regulatory protein